MLLVLAIIFFAVQEARFYGAANITNVFRQSTYLIIVTLGQALVLISGGFDLSVGAVIAVTSVVSARFMSRHYAGNPESEVTSVLVGIGAGLCSSACIFGLVNGIGVARFKVSPFIMTLGMASVGSGFALYYTGGSPVSGMPPLFTKEIGTGRWFEIPIPVLFAIAATVLVIFLVSSTAWGRYLYAIGGNTKAAFLSGIPVGVYTASVYVMCSLLAALAGILLTARVSSGEPNLGAELPAAIDHRGRRRRRLAARRRRPHHRRGARRALHHHPHQRHEPDPHRILRPGDRHRHHPHPRRHHRPPPRPLARLIRIPGVAAMSVTRPSPIAMVAGKHVEATGNVVNDSTLGAFRVVARGHEKAPLPPQWERGWGEGSSSAERPLRPYRIAIPSNNSPSSTSRHTGSEASSTIDGRERSRRHVTDAGRRHPVHPHLATLATLHHRAGRGSG